MQYWKCEKIKAPYINFDKELGSLCFNLFIIPKVLGIFKQSYCNDILQWKSGFLLWWDLRNRIIVLAQFQSL